LADQDAELGRSRLRGNTIETEDLVRAFQRAHISYGAVIDPADIDKLLKAEGINPASAVKPPPKA
jgi:hypothetical protein